MHEPSLYWVFLDTGPDPPQLSAEERAEMQEGHIENLMRLMHEGRNRLAGPVQGLSPVRGVVVLEVSDAIEVEQAFAPDPYIQAGEMVVRAHPWRLMVGGLGTASEPFGLGSYALGLVRRGRRPPEDLVLAMHEACELLGGDNAPRTVLAAGGLLETEDLVGTLLFRDANLERLRELVSQVPQVREGRLRVELYPLITARGLLDTAVSAD